MVAVGLSVVASGAVAKGSLRRFGARGHTHVASATAVGALLVWAGARSYRGITAACALESLGGSRSASVGAALTGLAVANGTGRGEMSACLAQMTTVTKVAAPLVYASQFASSGQARPFLTAAAFVAAAELLFALGDTGVGRESEQPAAGPNANEAGEDDEPAGPGAALLPADVATQPRERA